MSQIVITWVIPPPIQTALANKASPQALAHELGLDKLTQVVSVELSFEQLLQEARQVLRGLLLLLASPVKASSLASPASSSSSKSGRGGGEDDDRRWGRAQEALDGFVYQVPHFGFVYQVADDMPYRPLALDPCPDGFSHRDDLSPSLSLSSIRAAGGARLSRTRTHL